MHRWMRFAGGSVAALALTGGGALAASAGLTSVGGAVPGAASRAEARAALASVRLGAPNLPARLRGTRQSADAPNAASYNWSGYADTSTTANYFTSVSGGWVVPKVTCTKEDEIVSDWVGIDGWSDSTVEQLGTIGQCFEGKAIYYSWYEMYPAGTVEVGTTVKPGDHISAKVARSSTSYTLTLTDATTTGNNISTKQSCALTTCLDESVEWIAERPAYSIGIVPMAPFTTWALSSAHAAGGGKSGVISSFGTPLDVESVDATDTYELAIPGSLSSTGNSFKDAFQTSPGESY
ncbi:MAG TPA: G1 family glutamic endopeptidase [Acidimicrobiales bacterium]|nr:G1 family glutamic endopeptidase [Acidimicrobiales bacterium]